MRAQPQFRTAVSDGDHGLLDRACALFTRPVRGVPGTPVYEQARRRVIGSVLDNPKLVALFRLGAPLPTGYGVGFDERVVEYPWLAARAPFGRTLDAGSTLNHQHVLDRMLPHMHALHIVTLAPEAVAFPERGVSYTYCDLRELPFRDGLFDTVISISTLEHVGMDNRRFGAQTPLAEPRAACRQAVAELRRVLAAGGRLLATVPYGTAEDHGWFRVFDQAELETLLASAAAPSHSLTVYRYDASGWQLSDPGESSAMRYRRFDSPLPPDLASAARAVACLELRY